MFNLFGKKNTVSKEKEFWDWFLKNKKAIEQFIDSDFQDFSIYDQLSERMQNYNKLLYPEVTRAGEGAYVLIITPDGIKDGIVSLQALYDAKPHLENWIVKKFRQPNDDSHLNFNGIEYPSSDIEIFPKVDHEADKVHIQVFIKGMNKDPDKYQALAFLYLDHILGEFNTITKVGYIDFRHLDEGKRVNDGITLVQLRKLIEEELYLK